MLDKFEEDRSVILPMASKLTETGLLIGGVILIFVLLKYLPYLLGKILDLLRVPTSDQKLMGYEAKKQLEDQMLEKEKLGSEANEVYQSRQSW